MKQFIDSPNFLQTIRQEMQTNIRDAEQLVRGLRDDQMSWTAAPGTWSIAQCLDHLAVSVEGFDPYFRPALERGRRKWPADAPVPYKPTWSGGLLIRKFIVPEATRKVPSPKIFLPSQSPLIEDVLEKYLERHDQFLSVVKEAEGLNYNRTRLRSPVTPFLRYSLADAFVVVVTHNWRHLAQAKRVRDTKGFPS